MVVIILLALLLRLVAIAFTLYLIYFTIRCLLDGSYFNSFKNKPTLQIVKIVFMLGVISLSIQEYIFTSDMNAQIEKKMIEEDKKYNPILKERTEIGEFIFEKGTKLRDYNNSRSGLFLDATLPNPYSYRGLDIIYILNPDKEGATVKLAYPTTINGLEFVPHESMAVRFEGTRVDVLDGKIMPNQRYKNILWMKDTTARFEKNSTSIKGIANFTLEEKEYQTFLAFHHNKETKITRYYYDKKKITFRNGVKQVRPKYKTSIDENGQHFIKLYGLMPYRGYKMTELESGKEYFGEVNNKGATQKVVVEKQSYFYFDYYWARVKKE